MSDRPTEALPEPAAPDPTPEPAPEPEGVRPPAESAEPPPEPAPAAAPAPPPPQEAPPRPPALRLERTVKWRRSAAGGFAIRIEELVLPRGAVVGVVGPSGCGKSTLLDLLALAVRPDECAAFRLWSGIGPGHDVLAAWTEGGDFALAGLRRRHVGYVLQTGGLLPFVSVRDNIALTLRANGRHDDARVAELAERLGIGGQLAKHPRDLSIGQRQRVAIARAVAHRPAVLVADEPTSALDPENGRQVMDLLVDEARAADATLVIATHDAGLLDGRIDARVGFAPIAVDGAPGSAVTLAEP